MPDLPDGSRHEVNAMRDAQDSFGKFKSVKVVRFMALKQVIRIIDLELKRLLHRHGFLAYTAVVL
jgi:hypothetical protein